MGRFYGAVIETLAAAVFLVPVFLIGGRRLFRAGQKIGLYALFGLYLAAMLALVEFTNLMTLNIDLAVNIIPFLDMLPNFKNACLNVLLFIPFGIFLPALWSGFRSLRRTVLTGLAVSGVIELAQFFTFRTTDINDLITNTLGAALGFCIAKGFTQSFSTHTAAADGRDFIRSAVWPQVLCSSCSRMLPYFFGT